VTNPSRPEPPVWLASAAAWLTPRRLRAQAIILALCLWGVCAVDFATPGLFDRAGNIKFQDFLQFPIAARLIAQGQSSDLYNDQILNERIRSTVGRDTNVYLRYFYGPQVALAFVPLVRLPFLAQAVIWMTLSLLIYFVCIYLLWKSCGPLSPYPGFVALCAIAYPPLFHFFVRGQLSAAVLLCFVLAYFAFLARREWIAGIALGLLVFKPQFLVAIPLVLLLAQAWKALAGLAISAAAQLALTSIYFGISVMRTYFYMLLQSAASPRTTELILSPIQMHSLRAFWVLLIPWPQAVLVLYTLSAIAVIVMAAAVWRSSSPLTFRFSALILAAVLVSPHIYIYDLLPLALALLLLANWTLNNPHHPSAPAILLLSYLAFVLPLFGPLARWTHLQLSVPVFVALLWTLRQTQQMTGSSLSEEDALPSEARLS
jgi:alpha-1,2-mannosyltransferase